MTDLARWLRTRYRMTHHDAEDAAQDAWVAARVKGRTDEPYVRGCARYAAIDVMRANDREREIARRWRVANLSVVRSGARVINEQTNGGGGGRTPSTADHGTFLVPIGRPPALRGEPYREFLRAQGRVAARRRRAA